MHKHLPFILDTEVGEKIDIYKVIGIIGALVLILIIIIFILIAIAYLYEVSTTYRLNKLLKKEFPITDKEVEDHKLDNFLAYMNYSRDKLHELIR